MENEQFRNPGNTEQAREGEIPVPPTAPPPAHPGPQGASTAHQGTVQVPDPAAAQPAGGTGDVPSGPAPEARTVPASGEPGRGDSGEDSGPGQGFSASGAIMFALHALFCFAGRIADMIISLYNSVFRLDGDYVADFNKSRGSALARRKEWRRAVPALERALAANPDDLETRILLAEGLSALDRCEKAHLHFKKVLEARPDSARALRAVGLIHSRRQEYERSIEYLEKAAELEPGHAHTLFRLGTAYDNCKRFDRAADSYRKAIRHDPRFAKAYQALGFTYESMGDRESAVDCFKKALELE